jgi:hypothetical protein
LAVAVRADSIRPRENSAYEIPTESSEKKMPGQSHHFPQSDQQAYEDE